MNNFMNGLKWKEGEIRVLWLMGIELGEGITNVQDVTPAQKSSAF